MSTPSYPLVLDVSGRRVVVVGGGPVAARRARGLVGAGADVLLVAPYACEEVVELERSGVLRLELRELATSDLDGAWLVHTATGERSIDDAVALEADERRIWCVRADDAQASSAWVPAVARVDDVLVAVSGGGDPRRAVTLRNAVQTLLEIGELPIRRQRSSTAGCGSGAVSGSVALVGGGPGDPGLITTRGRQLLAQADVVVVDRLAPRALLDSLDDDVEVIEAGKAPHAHTLTQEQINAVLVERAFSGQRVVRLKGGDPFVLGRGGEEALACVAAGVPVEVVPGVTSAVAVPAAAGIPVTHRGISRQVTVLSAHEDPPDWSALAALEGTLILMMGVSRLREAARGLVAHGLAPDTPVAVVEKGTMPDQRTTIGPLAGIADRADERGVTSPAVIVVGDVVRLHEALG